MIRCGTTKVPNDAKVKGNAPACPNEFVPKQTRLCSPVNPHGANPALMETKPGSPGIGSNRFPPSGMHIALPLVDMPHVREPTLTVAMRACVSRILGLKLASK